MSMVACTEKAGEWPPLLTLMSNNSSVEHLQSDIADWFREHQPDAYDLAEPPSASKLGCESGVLSARDGNTPGRSIGKRYRRPTARTPPQPKSSMSAEGQDRGRVPVNMATDPPREHLHKGYTVERGPDGRSLWLPDSSASCSDRERPLDEDTAPFCTFMNVWSMQQEQDRDATSGQASGVEVLQRLPHSMFEAAARKLCKRSAALSVEECHQYKRAATLSVMTPPALRADVVRLRAGAGTCGSLTDLLPTPTSVLDGPAAFPPSPPQEESVDFLVASSPGSQSCVGESNTDKRRSPLST
ncbi:hypothetical protein COCSUDRAFT_43545 [Coccomyxa subellipsoidea C-169]|uniref:Uncharacterized protein n=1 Tax=Coccomyxa subellipsoidea (strain C-169) TaxID=574566 RepID=I0YS65_COCSC|nr:hypothetical protein COCSUDRAFT_43545 [Coccomyxa subellipsoidea C-169]EIE21234.1 hypothetical protein COCSUDRAFT_43545 [Coccomyxa subellipsoidea C-169]|eukprot:XP_005645778.1 hypothetical protein COCSUDRAFT_43545 [Coccomyxa subellipsoidea C-169]